MKIYYKRLLRKISVAGIAGFTYFSCFAQTTSPKNIIVVIGDGMGYSCIEAANYYTAGEANAQAYEKFPVMTWQSTFNAKNPTKGATDDIPLYYDMEYRSDSAWLDFDWVRRDADTSIREGSNHSNGQKPYNAARYTDSAPAATALATGKKTFDGSINIDIDGNSLTTIAQHALAIGKKAGVVTTVQLSHATPAGFIAHNPNRNDYALIAKEMLLETDLSVIIGTGHPDYDDDAQYVPGRNGYNYVGGQEVWEDLLTGNSTLAGRSPRDIDNDGQPDNWTLIQDFDDFVKIANGEVEAPKRLLGVPRAGATLQAYRSGGGDVVLEVPYNENVPNLSHLSLAALNTLKNDEGFFVMIEGGAIDWANHNNEAGRMIEEMIDLNDAVDEIIAWIEANGGWEENLLIVTTDHECGYILGPDTQNETVNNPVDNPIINNGKGNMPGLSYNSYQHTNMLCPIYAKGAGAELLKSHESRTDYYRGKYIDNTDIPRTLFSLWNQEEDKIKNFIMMISDGWGYNQVLATNYYEGKTQSYEDFPVYVPMSTFPGRRGNYLAEDALDLYTTGYNSNRAWSEFGYVMQDYTDSAPAASAMASGEKIYDSALNYSIDNTPLTTLPQIATAKGKSAGVVTSVELSHATPAGLGGAHSQDRNAYVAIAEEMLFDTNLSVIMGTGNPYYDNQGQPLETPVFTWIGEDAWNAVNNGEISLKSKTATDISGDGVADAWTLIQDSVDFARIARGENVPLRLLGVPKVHETLQSYRANPLIGASGDIYGDYKFGVGELPWIKELPRLSEMSVAALNVLNQNENGFYIMIEGGAVDWANHANQLGIMIEDQMDFNTAVDAVIEWIEENSNWDETLLVVTGDHECGYLLGPDTKGKTDNSPITNPVVDNGKGNIPGHSYNSGNHTNQLIPLYAKGANAEKLNDYLNNYDYIRGYYLDNTDLPHLVLTQWNQLNNQAPKVSTSINKEITGTKKSNILSIYPTLVEDVLTIETEKDQSIEIINLNGQIIFRTIATGNISEVDLTNLSKGLYIVNAGGKQAKMVKK